MAEPNDTIAAALSGLGVPYAYRKFKGRDVQAPPYITYYIEREQFYGPDSGCRLKKSSVVIELYTDHKDFALEGQLEAILAPDDFEKSEDFDETDELYRITFVTELTLKLPR
ncbi:MAG: hypothetical protein IKQ10_02010 [Oscillospiraceae bacterium]|nr:hypothetical protein [Oscillospiraceae bacterium]